MNASPEPTGDGELLRLLDAYCRDWCVAGDGGDCEPMYASLAALLDYLAEHYVRRTPFTGADNDAARLAAWRYRAARGILPWRPGDELPEDAIRRLRDATD